MQNNKYLKLSFAGEIRCILAAISFVLMAVIFFLNINCLKDYDYENTNMMVSLIIINLLICLLLVIKIDMHELLQKIYSYMWFIAVPYILLDISGVVVVKNFTFLEPIFYKNLVFYFVLQLVIYAITNRMKISIMMSFTIWWIIFVVDYFVIQFRGVPIVPADFYSVGTAAEVAGNYQFDFSVDIVNFIQVYVLVLLVTIFYCKEVKMLNKKHLFRGVSLGIAIFFVIIIAKFEFEENSVGFYQYKSNGLYGIVYNMYMNINNMKVNKPEYYDEEAVCELINDNVYSNKEIDDDKETADNSEVIKPNIIAIMNESFADLRVFGEIETTTEYFSFYDEFLKRDDVYSGNLLVSAFGGSTCNTEFEFLTGYSMIFFPFGTTPYNQYITKDVPSINSHLKEFGYSTKALHPFWANCWQRDTNYVYLGFDDFISGEDFVKDEIDRNKLVDMGGRDFGDDVEYVRNYISDREDYKKLISLYEEKEDGQPLFTFNITIQNHGGYTYDEEDFVDEVVCENYWYYQVDEYLTLMKITDESLEYLINYFENYDEPTIIVFFGDHHPSLGDEFYSEVFGKSEEELLPDEFQLKYMTPYFIWGNYDMNKIDAPELTSANYLHSLVLEAAGLESDLVSKCMDKVIDKYPAMNRNAVMTSEGRWIEIEDALKDPDLQMYNNLVYYQLFEQ